jgi:hypothetical protein
MLNALTVERAAYRKVFMALFDGIEIIDDLVTNTAPGVLGRGDCRYCVFHTGSPFRLRATAFQRALFNTLSQFNINRMLLSGFGMLCQIAYVSAHGCCILDYSMKPDTPVAMQQLIDTIRQRIPFDLPEAYVCSDDCNGCSMKLLEYLDMELIEWERRLDAGDRPNFGDINRLAKMAKKIYRVLDKNGLVKNAVS